MITDGFFSGCHSVIGLYSCGLSRVVLFNVVKKKFEFPEE